MHPTMLECTAEAIASLRKTVTSASSVPDSPNASSQERELPTAPSSTSCQVDIDQWLVSLTLEIICRCAFGARIGSQGDMAGELLSHMSTFYRGLLDGFSLTTVLPVLR